MRRAGGLIAAMLCGAALAAPADDHQRGLAAYRRGDVAAAIGTLRPAAQAGHAPSQVLLGFILEHGDFAMEAAALYGQAAAQGDAEGHASLASLLLGGRGNAKDEKAAREHFSKAAALGHAGARQALDQLARAASGARP